MAEEVIMIDNTPVAPEQADAEPTEKPRPEIRATQTCVTVLYTLPEDQPREQK
jgi:hypothetical protein